MALIKIERDGTINCNKKEYSPTKEEVEQIKGALMAAEWPNAILASNINLLQKQIKADRKDLFVFWSRKETGIIMVQQRCVFKDGGKAYLPWTLFSDGEWKRMEPDGNLPFWKPDNVAERQRTKIMIHEGAKAAAHVDWMINSSEKEAKELRKQHPWAEELAEYEHWGMIGGALAPHRADYQELWHQKPVEVVYICDNDWTGKAAIEDVSRHWGGSLKCVKFDTRWPPSFDLGDEFSAKTCPHLFAETGRYIGPSMESILLPATWATELKYSGEKGRPTAVIRRGFREEWLHAVRPEVFIHISRPNKFHSVTEFNTLISPFSDVDDTARLLKKDSVGKGAELSYEPNRKPGLYGSSEKGYYINTHVPSAIQKEKGDYSIWTRFLEYLFPVDEDRLEAERWVATLIARPDIKMHYGMLLISETQGVGKTSLGEKILKPLIGSDNVSSPNEDSIVDSAFNTWAAHKRLAIVSEIYAGHSSKAYDRLKSVITDRDIEVNKKFQSQYTIDNWVHILASSNSLRALKLSTDDRRWFVPRVTEEKQDWAWWEKLNKWITDDGGLGKIKYWAEEFLKKNDPVKPGESAPWSSVKKEMIEEGLSQGLQIVARRLTMIKEVMNGSHFAINDSDLVIEIKDELYDGKFNEKLERPATVRKLAKSMGFHVSKKRYGNRKWGTLESNPRLVVSSAALVDLPFEEIDELTGGPINIKEFLNKHGKM